MTPPAGGTKKGGWDLFGLLARLPPGVRGLNIAQVLGVD